MNKVICIVGPTASGKTGLAIELAKKIKDVFPSNKDFLYEVRCWNNNSKDDFSDASCQLFCFSNEHEKYISNTFEIINYLQQNYNGIRISLIVASSGDSIWKILPPSTYEKRTFPSLYVSKEPA